MIDRVVLHVVLRWQSGGVESFIQTLVSSKELNQYSQLVYSFLDRRIVDSKKTDVVCDCGSSALAEAASAVIALKKTLSKIKPDVVHVHTNNGLGLLIVSVAQKEGVPLCIVHAHNSSLGYGSGAPKIIANKLLMRIFGKGNYLRVACSRAAGDYLFDGKDYEIIKNSIEVDKFRFSNIKRTNLRQQLSIENRIVLGCCGSLIPAKNIRRLISITTCLLAKEPNIVLLIVGSGPEESALHALVEESGIYGQVIFAGRVEYPEAFYSAFDVLIMTSFYEGLPLTAIEAQSSGLSLVLSDSITNEVDISGDCTFVSLSEEDEVWAEAILCEAYNAHLTSREDKYMNAITKGYDKPWLISEISRMWSR